MLKTVVLLNVVENMMQGFFEKQEL